MAMTKERLREAVQTLEKYKAGKANFENRVIENEQWWKLRHWEHIPEKGTTALKTKSAWLVNVILSKHADAMDAMPEPSFLPRERSDEPEANMLSSVVPVIHQQADFEKTWSDCWWKKLKCGVAIYGVFWDSSKLGGLGDIAIKYIDPLQIFWEPGVTDLQRSQNVFHVELQDNKTLEQQYPQLKGQLSTSSLSLNKYRYDDNVDTSEKSAVVDWYYKENGVLHYCKFVNEEILFSTEGEETEPEIEFGIGTGDPSVTGKPPSSVGGFVPSSVIRLAGDRRMPPSPQGEGLGAGNPLIRPTGTLRPASRGGFTEDLTINTSFGNPEVSAWNGGQAGLVPTATPEAEPAGLYEHGEYPFYFDVLFPEEGTITGYGYIDIEKDAQRQIDLMNNAIVANAIAAATPRYFVRGDGSGINEEEFADWSRPFIHIDGQIEEQRIRQLDVNPLSGNYIAILQNKVEEMKETSGNRDVNNGGAAAGVTAASAIAAMQEQSGKLSRDQIQSSYRTVRQVDNCVVELIRQFYDAPRTFRILGQDGMAQYVQFDNMGMLPQLQDGDIRLPVFDIEIVAAKQSSYSKLSYNELALQLYQLGMFNPQMSDQALIALDMMDFKGLDKVRQKVEQNGTMLQIIQQMQMQIQQLSAMLGIQTGMQPASGPPLPEGGSAKVPEADAIGGLQQNNRITEKAKAQAQQSTQPR